MSCIEPLKSKLNRYESAMKGIETAFRAIKSERLRNLNLIVDSEFPGIKTGRIPQVSSLVSKIESCTNWQDLRKIVAVLREIRFLGSPKRTEISAVLLNKLSEIYENNGESDAILVELFGELLEFDQMNPLILPEIVSEESKDVLKTIIYTAKDILNKH